MMNREEVIKRHIPVAKGLCIRGQSAAMESAEVPKMRPKVIVDSLLFWFVCLLRIAQKEHATQFWPTVPFARFQGSG